MNQPETEDPNSRAEPEVTEAEDIELLREALVEAKTKAEENLAGWQRAQADFINYKRRTEQEKEDTSRFANSILMLTLLPVLDDLQRALTSIPPQLAKLPWADGIRMIERKFQTSLEVQGLTEIKALGEPFDPNLHEAMRQGKGKEGIVIEETQKGYKLHDRVLRPSQVVVGNGEEEENKED